MPRKRRRRAWGSITEVTRGRKYVLRWVENTDRGRRRLSHTFHGTYAEASLWLDRKHAELGDASTVPTVSECARMWYVPHLARQVEAGAIRQSTMDMRLRVLERVVEPFMGSACIDSVDVAKTQEWLLSMPKGTAVTALTVMRGVDRLAYRFLRYDDRPLGPDIEYETAPRFRKTKADTVWTRGEAARAADLLRGNDVLEGPFILAAFGGARVTESAAVRASEVEADEAHGVRCAVVPIVRRTHSQGHGVTADGELKNRQSVRVAVIPEPYGVRLLEVAERRRQDGMEWLAGDVEPPSGASLSYYWRRFCEESGVGYIPFSNLRKTWRTFMQSDYHVPWEVLEVLMGHKIAGVTGEHYYKPNREQLVSEVCRCASDGISWDMAPRSSR